MNPNDQRLLAKAKLENRIKERRVQIKAKLESILYELNEYVHGLENLDIEAADILMKDLKELYPDYQAALKDLKELGE